MMLISTPRQSTINIDRSQAGQAGLQNDVLDNQLIWLLFASQNITNQCHQDRRLITSKSRKWKILMTNENRNIQFCKNTLEPAPAPSKNRGSFLLQPGLFFEGEDRKHPSVTGVIPVCWCLEGSLKDRASFLASRVVITWWTVIYAESSVLSLPGEAIIKLESVMGRETMGPVRDVRRSLVNSISRWQWGRVTWRFMDNSDNHISSRPTIHQWL